MFFLFFRFEEISSFNDDSVQKLVGSITVLSTGASSRVTCFGRFSQRDLLKTVDNRPDSAVYVEGPDVMALFNFLLNCRSCVNPSGELAGVPPTLVAPCPFKSATLTSLAVRLFALASSRSSSHQLLDSILSFYLAW